MSNNEDLILLNRMYAGEFLNNNIGFEAINLVKADDDTSYIYVTPYGTMAEDKYEKVKEILFVKPYVKGSYQIIAKAVGLQLSEEIKNSLHTKEDLRKKQEDKIEQIKYSDISYNEIFVDNRSTTKKGNSINGAYYTYTGKVFLAKKLLTISDSDFINCTKKLFRTSLKMFISKSDVLQDNTNLAEEKAISTYDYLQNLIKNEDNWDSEEVKKIDCNNILRQGFISILRKEYDELSFSNLFSYIFLNYPKAFAEFYKNVLCTDKNIKDQSVNGFTFDCDNDIKIEREKDNIDLKLTDINGNVIVIENKIKAEINGADFKVLEDSINKNSTELGLVEKDKDVGVEVEVESQLSKYYSLVTSNLEDKAKAMFFIFVPNYHNLQLKQNIFRKGLKEIKWSYKNASNYSIIKYSEIYNFYKSWFESEENQAVFKDDLIAKFYFEEFLLAVEKHSKDVDNQLEEDLKIRFNNKILEINKRKFKL